MSMGSLLRCSHPGMVLHGQGFGKVAKLGSRLSEMYEQDRKGPDGCSIKW